MRKILVGVVCALALGAPSIAPAQEREGWSYAYVEGVATATQRDGRGRVTVTLTCRPPEGDIVINDYTLVRSARRAEVAAVRIGAIVGVCTPERSDPGRPRGDRGMDPAVWDRTLNATREERPKPSKTRRFAVGARLAPHGRDAPHHGRPRLLSSHFTTLRSSRASRDARRGAGRWPARRPPARRSRLRRRAPGNSAWSRCSSGPFGLG